MKRCYSIIIAMTAVLFAVFGVAGATADPIAAAVGDCVTTRDGGAKACFYSSGDSELLELCDNRPDGHHPGAFYTVQSSPNTQRLVEIFTGFPSCAGYILQLPERSWIDFRALNIEGNDILSASPWIRSYA